MKATPFTHPGFALMKQTDIQSFFHMQMPRWLFFDSRYNAMSLEAKVAYTFLLNRFQLSKLNGWVNPDGEVFIIYTRNSLSGEMQISYRKVISAMKELSLAKLIYERRCGRGDANQIYLAKVDLTDDYRSDHESAPFVSEDIRSADTACLGDGDDAGNDSDNGGGDIDGGDGGDAPRLKSATDSRHADIAHQDDSGRRDRGGRRNSERQSAADSPAYQYSPVYRDSQELMPVSGLARHETSGQDMQDPHIKMCDSDTSRDAKPARQEVRNRHASNTDVSITEKSDIDNSRPVSYARARDRPDGDEINELRELDDILEDCELWTFPDATARVFENAIERLFFSERFKIGGAVLPRKKIRSHLHQLDCVRLQDAASKLAENRERKVKNSTAYVMAVVFNSIWESDSDVLCDPYLNSLTAGKHGCL
jgi:hypothetical protein